MQITLTPEARDYLTSRQQRDLTIFLAELNVQCCVPYNPPEVRLGRPTEPEVFQCVTVGDIRVHLPKAVARHQSELTIVLQGIGPFRHLSLQGWRPFGVTAQ